MVEESDGRGGPLFAGDDGSPTVVAISSGIPSPPPPLPFSSSSEWRRVPPLSTSTRCSTSATVGRPRPLVGIAWTEDTTAVVRCSGGRVRRDFSLECDSALVRGCGGENVAVSVRKSGERRGDEKAEVGEDPLMYSNRWCIVFFYCGIEKSNNKKGIRRRKLGYQRTRIGERKVKTRYGHTQRTKKKKVTTSRCGDGCVVCMVVYRLPFSR